MIAGFLVRTDSMLVRTGTSEYILHGWPAGFCAWNFALLKALISRTVQADTQMRAQTDLFWNYSFATLASGLGTLCWLGRGWFFGSCWGFWRHRPLSRCRRVGARELDSAPDVEESGRALWRKGVRLSWAGDVCRHREPWGLPRRIMSVNGSRRGRLGIGAGVVVSTKIGFIKVQPFCVQKSSD